MKQHHRIAGEKYSHLFDTEHLKDNLKRKSVKSGLSAIAAEIISFVLRIGSTVVFARILMPEDFGLISMVTAIIAIAEMSKDLGLSTATIQTKNITHQQVTNLFWINTGLGVLIMFVVASLSYVFAWFYSETRLVPITLALSLSFFFGGLTIQHDALLRRQMQFGRLAWIKIVSTLMSIAVGIWLGLHGYEYWALVWKEITAAVFIAVGTWLLCPWLPGLPARTSGVTSMLSKGLHVTGYNFIYFLSQSIDQILIGRLWGAGSLGYYRQAKQLVLVPVNQLQNPVGNVSLPLLSALQNEPDRYRDYYRKIISILAFATMPIATYLFVYSKDLIHLLLGDKWMSSAPICSAFAIAVFLRPVLSTCEFVMVASGQTRRYLLWGLISALWVVASFIIGAYWGPLGIAYAYAISIYVAFLPSLWFSFQNTPVSISLVFKAMSNPAISSLLMGFVLTIASQMGMVLGSALWLIVSLCMGSMIYCGAFLLHPGGKKELREYVSYLAVVFKTKTHTVQVDRQPQE